MHNHIFHFCIVHRALRCAAPGFLSGRKIREYANKVDSIKILKIEGAGVFNATAHDEMHFAHGQCLGSVRAKINPIASAQS